MSLAEQVGPRGMHLETEMSAWHDKATVARSRFLCCCRAHMHAYEYSYAAVHRDNEWITITITQARLSPSVSPSRPLSAVGVVVPTMTVSSHRSGHIVFRQT